MSNLKNLKLKLTVALVNKKGENIIQIIRDFMHDVKEAGKFVGTKVIDQIQLNQSTIQETYALQFENMTLNLSMITNKNGSHQVLNGFQLR